MYRRKKTEADKGIKNEGIKNGRRDLPFVVISLYMVVLLFTRCGKVWSG
ncbi:hypothetical protein MHLNE_15000 [Moorella humiferrea]